jgi:hypothetical protein
MKLMKSLKEYKRNWIRRVAQENQEITGLLMRKEEQEVLANITITPRGIPIRENTTDQVFPLSRSIRGLGWIIYLDK